MKQTFNIVIPMAGLGTRFEEKGYKNKKPFIDVNGKPMIQRVIENLKMEFEPDVRVPFLGSLWGCFLKSCFLFQYPF